MAVGTAIGVGTAVGSGVGEGAIVGSSVGEGEAVGSGIGEGAIVGSDTSDSVQAAGPTSATAISRRARTHTFVGLAPIILTVSFSRIAESRARADLATFSSWRVPVPWLAATKTPPSTLVACTKCHSTTITLMSLTVTSC